MLSQCVFVLKMTIKQDFSPVASHVISVLVELTSGHLRYPLTDVPPQPNSPTDSVFCKNHPSIATMFHQKPAVMQVSVQTG